MSNDARFSIIPGWIVTDHRLKGRDLQVLCLLGRHTDKHGWCFRSQVKMAAQLDCARSTVQASIDRLIDIGVLEKHTRELPGLGDTAHSYRVIYDRAPDAGYDFDAYLAAEEQENDPISGASEGRTPADISAPPADHGAAPPAGSGSAPYNAPSLTTPDERKERERERGFSEGEGNAKAVEREFKRFFIGWGTAISDSEPDARREWSVLTAEERQAAQDGSAVYQEIALSTGRKYLCSAAKYLKERRWEKLPALKAKTAAPAAIERHNAYSRPWAAHRLALLSQHPVQLFLDKFEDKIIADAPEKADAIWRNKREKAGWPDVVKMHELARERKQVVVPPHIVALAATGFDKVEVGGDVWEAWKRLHHERCWPWLPEPQGLPFVQFPALPDGIDDPDEAVLWALKDFQKRMIEERDHDDAA
ncbi:helix-turn-helix domain-containing protein [Neorhizobium huautlense]|nr:helix-turn-helix domain-containing protein [Neorhizobium huautlense]